MLSLGVDATTVHTVPYTLPGCIHVKSAPKFNQFFSVSRLLVVVLGPISVKEPVSAEDAPYTLISAFWPSSSTHLTDHLKNHQKLSPLSEKYQCVSINKVLNESLAIQLLKYKKNLVFWNFKKKLFFWCIFLIVSCQHICLIFTYEVSKERLCYPLSILARKNY